MVSVEDAYKKADACKSDNENVTGAAQTDELYIFFFRAYMENGWLAPGGSNICVNKLTGEATHISFETYRNMETLPLEFSI